MRLWRGGDSAEANARAFLCGLAVIVRPRGLWCQCADMQAVGNTCRFALRNVPFWGAVCAVLCCRTCRLAVRCRRGELGPGVPLPFGGLCLGLMLAGNGRRRALLRPCNNANAGLPRWQPRICGCGRRSLVFGHGVYCLARLVEHVHVELLFRGGYHRESFDPRAEHGSRGWLDLAGQRA